MAAKRHPRHKVSRRFGVDIYGTGGASLARRLNTPPGGQRAAGRRPRRPSEYGLQLREKQKVKGAYGVSESQFRRYFGEAFQLPGVTGHNLLQLLERRLDNVIYRLGFARSRPMARQLVGHGHVLVNGRRVTIPSYRVSPGDRVALTQAAARMPQVEEELASRRALPHWLDRTETEGQVRALPTRDDVDLPVDDNLIVAFYAR
jgi:small subunit ribosomal protein S4